METRLLFDRNARTALAAARSKQGAGTFFICVAGVAFMFRVSLTDDARDCCAFEIAAPASTLEPRLGSQIAPLLVTSRPNFTSRPHAPAPARTRPGLT